MALTGWAEKNWTKFLVAILVVWQLLSGFCLHHPMLCDCEIEEKMILQLLSFTSFAQNGIQGSMQYSILYFKGCRNNAEKQRY